MKKILVAFDVDGTLIRTGAADERDIVANRRICNLLIILANLKFANVRRPDGTIERRKIEIIVWSGGGELWAQTAVAVLGLQKYVDKCANKIYLRCPDCVKPCNHHRFNPNIKPHIAIDDIHNCELGSIINLIVREK